MTTLQADWGQRRKDFPRMDAVLSPDETNCPAAKQNTVKKCPEIYSDKNIVELGFGGAARPRPGG